MKTIIKVKKKDNGKIQYLTEVLPEIPTNTILCKTLTGLGATYSEIKAKRNSIILEPNKPVIAGKTKNPVHQNDNLIGVFEGVSTDKIIDYLNKTVKKKKYIKIITTPESFYKVQVAMDEMEINIATDCFLLYDECHKIVEDVDYREDITLPMDLFFQCENKALVSATPHVFTDERFKCFNTIEIVPNFDYKKDINLHITNNVLQSMKETISAFCPDKPIFIFCNSTDNIYAMMKQIDIMDESAVFCSKKSVDKLKLTGFKSVSEIWEPKEMKRFNWMTSRFYNALDIEIEVQPIVVLFTDSYFTEYTCFDPTTDTIQCVGRFRNGVSEIHHITNTNSHLRTTTREDAMQYVHESKVVYDTISRFKRQASNLITINVLGDTLKCLPFTKWVNPDLSINTFAIDNYIEDEVVKSYYSNQELLINAYRTNDHFNTIVTEDNYPLGDYERLCRNNKSMSIKEKRKLIVDQLVRLNEDKTGLCFILESDIRAADSFIVDAYYLIGKEEIERLKYNRKRITEAMIIAKYKQKIRGTEMVRLVNNIFHEGRWYEAKFIKTELSRLYKLLGIDPLQAVTSHTINDFFLADERRKKNGRGYYLIKRLTA